ncbi:MAG: DNA primase, partial [Candidatus Omnitrophota bacterium]
AIQFLMLYEKVSFVEAIEILAKRLGLSIPYQRGEKSNIKAILYDAVAEASLFFHKNLLEGSGAKPVFEYLAKRGIDKEAISTFKLGYAPPRNSLLDYLRSKRFTLEILEKASLVIPKGAGFRDLFQERIMFPIFDVRKRAVGFGARIWKVQNDAPKYINSPENFLYSKREHLFGLHLSKDDIVRSNAAIVVEGYLDMIVPFMRGIRNVVASLGTALTLEQIRRIKRYTSNIILVFDSDKAGQIATARAIDLLLENELKVEMVSLPGGYDPDSLVRQKGTDYFLHIIDAKKDFFDYKKDILKDIYDVESIEGKTKIAQEMLSTIDKLTSEVAKFEYIKKLSHFLKVKEEILIAEYRRVFLSAKKVRRETLSDIGAMPVPITEKILLKWMLIDKRAFSLIKKNLKDKDFTHPSAQRAVSYLLKDPIEDANFGSSHILSSIHDKEISGFVSSLLMDDGIPFTKENFKESLLKLRKNRIREMKDRLREEIKDAEKVGDKTRLKSLISKYRRMYSREVKPHPSRPAFSSLSEENGDPHLTERLDVSGGHRKNSPFKGEGSMRK